MDKNDIRFDRDGYRFQLRVGAIIIEDGCILLAKCDSADYYYSVGGAVHVGETAQDAVRREVFEETGVHYEVDSLKFVQENFFEDDVVLKGGKVHEVSLFFMMKPRGVREINRDSSVCGGGVEHMHWVKLDKLSGIRIYPRFFPEKLGGILRGVEHIVNDELNISE